MFFYFLELFKELFCEIIIWVMVRTKGDKAGSNQPPTRDPVHFKLELMPKVTIEFRGLETPTSDRWDTSPCSCQTSTQSLQNLQRKAILELQEQLSQHDLCKLRISNSTGQEFCPDHVEKAACSCNFRIAFLSTFWKD